jgi:hypothetical protein
MSMEVIDRDVWRPSSAASWTLPNDPGGHKQRCGGRPKQLHGSYQMIQRVKDRDDPEEPEPIVFVVVKVRFLISTLLMYSTSSV